MAAIPLVYTQLMPPRGKYLIKRTRLRNTGLAILSHRVTTVVAPAGYGKSIWIASLLEEAGWPPAAWLSLDRHDVEPSFLLYHLVYALQRILPGFGRDTLRTMNSLEDAGRNWTVGASALIEELAPENEMLLVLDDFHLIDRSVAAGRIIEYLIHWLPAGVHMVLLSRTSIPLNLYRERMNNELLEIQGAELLFSTGETRELLLRLGIRLNEAEINQIQSYTEGWAAGLRLLAIWLKQTGGSIDRTFTELGDKDANLYTCLGNELLANVSEGLYSFLLDSSLLPYLEPCLCDAALECCNSEDFIVRLHAHGVLSRIEGEPVTWRLHHLMGEFLEQKMRSLRSVDYINHIRHRAAAFLQGQGNIDRALEQLAACADWTGMADIISISGDRYFLQSGRLDALESWLGRLPGEVVSGSPWLLYFKAMTILHSSPDEALGILSRATDAARELGDLKCQLRSLFSMIASYTFANNLEKVRETAKRIPLVASLFKNPWSRGVLLVAALSQAVWEDNLRRGVRLSWLAGRAELDPEAHMGYLLFSSMIQFRMGNLREAREFIQKALDDSYVQEHEQWTGTVKAIYSFICMLSGDHDEMEQICQEVLRLGRKYDAPHQLGVAHRRLAHLCQENGRPDQAKQEYRLSRENFIRANNVFMAYLTELDIILLRIKSGQSARDLFTESELLLKRLKAIPAGQGFDDYTLSAAGIIAMEAGDLETARQYFEEVSQISRNKGARQVLAGTRLLLARVHLLKGDDTTADICLRQALGAAEEEKWEYFWDWHAESVYTLCWRALSKNIHPYWAVHLLQRWFPQRTAEEAGILLAHPHDRVHRCIAALLRELASKTGTTVIHANFLGGFRVFVNGAEIKPYQWKNRKTENLFKLLVIEKRHQPKEKYIEKLWPEAEPRLGDASLRMAASHVRQAVGIGEKNGGSIILKRGIISMNPNLKVYTDYEMFASAARNALHEVCAENPASASLLEQAAGLYPGDFLPDNIYDDWTSGLRTEMKALYMKVLSKKIEIEHRQGRFHSAINGCRHYLNLDPVDEPVCRMAMEMLWQSGQKQQALSIYKKLAASMIDEYNASPAMETTALYEKMACE